jgi:uncharacterized protein involved in oxidation of intracellular sulfur
LRWIKEALGQIWQLSFEESPEILLNSDVGHARLAGCQRSPYGTERVYNGLRLALALLNMNPPIEFTVFLLADAVLAANARQKTPEGYYNIERMLKRVLAGNGKVLLCGTCTDARGLDETKLLAGASRSTMDELAAATMAADKVLVF